MLKLANKFISCNEYLPLHEIILCLLKLISGVEDLPLPTTILCIMKCHDFNWSLNNIGMIDDFRVFISSDIQLEILAHTSRNHIDVS
jgi:hypothetical protein